MGMDWGHREGDLRSKITQFGRGGGVALDPFFVSMNMGEFVIKNDKNLASFLYKTILYH